MAGDITRYGQQYLRKYFMCNAQRKNYLNYIDYETISQYYFFDLVSFAKKVCEAVPTLNKTFH